MSSNHKREAQVNDGTSTTTTTSRMNLMSRIEQAMKGFHGLNAIAYKHKNEYVTYSRPGDCLKVPPENMDNAEFIPDRKEVWPVLNNMQTNLPIHTIKRRPNRVNDIEYIVPQSDKQPIIPKPILPQSKGLKLRPIDEIINDGKLLGNSSASSKKKSLSTSSTATMNITRTPTAASTSNKSATTTATTKPTSKIQGVLDIITSGHSNGSSHNNGSHGNNGNKSAIYNNNNNNSKLMKSTSSTTTTTTTTTNRPRKPSLLKSEITSSSSSTPTIKVVEDTHQPLGSKKPMSSLTNTHTVNRPRVSSKSTSTQKHNKYNQDVPDLLEAKNYLLDDIDELEYKKLDHLVEPNYNTQNMKRPILLLHFKTSSPALKKAAEKFKSNNDNVIPSTTTTPTPTKNSSSKSAIKSVKKEEISSSVVNKKINAAQSATAKEEKNASPTIVKSELSTTKEINTKTSLKALSNSSPPPSIAQPTPETPIIKKSLSDRPPKSIKPENSSSLSSLPPPPPPPSSTTSATTENNGDKQAYPSSIPSAFLRSMKIPKRKTFEIELEEGETISPSPSPHHSSINTIIPPLPSSSATSTTAPTPVNTVATSTPPLVKVESNTSSISSTSKRSRNEDKNEIAVTPVTSSSVVVTPIDTTLSNSNKKHSSSSNSRRDEERSSSSRRSTSDRYHDDRRSTTTKSSSSHRSSRYRSRSKSRSRSPRSRSPTTRSHRSESRSKQTSTRRQTSSESTSRRRQSSPVSLISRDKRKNPDSSRYDLDNGGTSNSSSSKRQRNEKETSSSIDKYTSSSSSSKKVSLTSSTTTTAAEKTISATAPNAETPEQFRVFSLMFGKLAHANKRRGDTQTEPILGMIDHFHAVCDYILNFYYNDQISGPQNTKQGNAAWKSIFPFTDSLCKKLEKSKDYELYGLCMRLNALIRFYMYSRLEQTTRPMLIQQIKHSHKDVEKKNTDLYCIELSENVFHEHEKAERTYKESERHLNYGTLVTQYPKTFRNVCMEGNLLAGITLGGEAGVSVSPMFPFVPYSPLHHAAIVSKCILAEYVSKNNLKYTPISKPEEFM